MQSKSTKTTQASYQDQKLGKFLVFCKACNGFITQVDHKDQSQDAKRAAAIVLEQLEKK